MRCALILALLVPLAAHAQAPIERRPPPPPTKSDQAWAHLQNLATHNDHEELRIQAFGEPLRCNLNTVTATEIFCTEYRPMPGLNDIVFPRQPYRIPRTDIVDVRAHGRADSTLVGIGLGFALGAGLGSLSNPQNKALDAIIFSVIGEAIGHFIPFKGHVLYRAH